MKMSKYTTEVRFLCEFEAGLTESKGYNTINEIINSAYPKIFNFDFPIFNEAYRPLLCKKILRHYYTREIGEETAGLWKLRLETRLNEIMPYYNQLYQSELLEFNPFYDVDLTRDHTLQRDGTREYEDTNSATGTGNTTTKYSDTPQGSLQNVIAGTYLTDATVQDTSSSTSGQSSADETTSTLDDFLEHVQGKQGGASYSQLLKQYRETFLNIDMMVIEELDDLFMQIW